MEWIPIKKRSMNSHFDIMKWISPPLDYAGGFRNSAGNVHFLTSDKKFFWLFRVFVHLCDPSCIENVDGCPSNSLFNLIRLAPRFNCSIFCIPIMVSSSNILSNVLVHRYIYRLKQWLLGMLSTLHFFFWSKSLTFFFPTFKNLKH